LKLKLLGAILFSLLCWAYPISTAAQSKPKETKVEQVTSLNENPTGQSNIPITPSPSKGNGSVVSPRPSSGRNNPSPNCEAYQETIEKYFGVYADQAIFVATKESGCQNIRSHKINANGTWDYCIFQINNEPSALEIETCVRRAWEKFKGSNYAWRQWYAVCAPKTHIPKYQNIKCN
jgi:hypothetical protein